MRCWPGSIYACRYEVVPTPLTRLVWWRVVLDEAQMVESSTAKAAEMACKLQAVHRCGGAGRLAACWPAACIRACRLGCGIHA